MAVTQVQIQAMAQAAVAYDNAVSSHTALHNGINQEINSLASVWTGDAAVKYVGAMEIWSNRYTDAINALEEMYVALTGTHKNYQEVDVSQQDIAAAVSGNTNSLAAALGPGR